MPKSQEGEAETSISIVGKIISFFPVSLPAKIYNTLSIVPVFRVILNKIILSRIPPKIIIPEGLIVLDQTDVAVSGSLALGVFENAEIDLFRKCFILR